MRIFVQGPLGFSAGLSLPLLRGTLAARLAMAGVDIKTIGLFALASLPSNLKFLWAPLLDRYRLPWLGPRRGWLIVSQGLLAALLWFIGMADPLAPTSVAVLAFGASVVAATQDILVDAYRTDILEDGEVGRGAGLYVLGYRTAMILGGGVALMLSDVWSWQAVYASMAALQLIGVAFTLLAPAAPVPVPETLATAVLLPLKEFFARRYALVALLFVMLYKFGDATASNMISPFLVELGFSGTEIGGVQKALGIAMTIVGAGAGGALVDRLTLPRALLYFGAAQAVANLGYVFLALHGKSLPLLVAAVGFDNVCNGLGTAAFVACIAALCSRNYSATQYAVLTSAMSVLAHTIGAWSGWVVDGIGWAGYFAMTIVVAIPALALVSRLPFLAAAERAPQPVAADGD